MNRWKMMQTQSPLPIRNFNSRITLAATNSSRYAGPEAIDRKPIPFPVSPVLLPDLASSDSSGPDCTGAVSLKFSQQSISCHPDGNKMTTASPVSTVALDPSAANAHECLMQLTINADCIAELRHLVMRTCGEWIVFIRTQPIAHATKMKVWLGLSSPAVDLIMEAVMHALPSAEFGPITHS